MKRLEITLLKYIVLIFFAIVLAGPFVWMVSASFRTQQDLYQNVLSLIPRDPSTGKIKITLENYIMAFKYLSIWRMGLNSLIVALSATALNLFFDSLAAYSFERLSFPFKKIIFSLLLSTMMIPYYVTLIPSVYIVKKLGLYNTLLGLIIPFAASVYAIFMLTQFLKGIPRELDEAAIIDGCGYFGVYWYVILPLLKPALIAIGVFTFLWHWNNFLWPLIILDDPEKFTLPIGIAKLSILSRGAKIPLIMAATTVAVAPIIFLFLLGQRYFIQGLTMSGLKG